ncbi:MAG: hypothetical protein WCP89_00865 [archaeon]
MINLSEKGVKSEKVRVSYMCADESGMRKMKILDEKVSDARVSKVYFVKKSMVKISEACNSLRFCRFLP